ncbi:MAG: RloB domain-containing protein [Peptococcaceae bacterium]|nr:RloB domain-containing protein [Peptococcaceae bacterium]
MAGRKSTKKYYFSVEGETEQWYLKWLQDTINLTEASICKVSFHCPVQKDPLKHAKSLVVTRKTEVYHFSDYESDEPVHVQQFIKTMDNMKRAKELGKQVNYRFGYSNLTFDLWIILHKEDCNRSVSHRRNYINLLNRAYQESFESMDEYKQEANFKRCLGKLQLSNVIAAANRAKNTMQRNQDNGYTLHHYRMYKYYKENPSLTIWEPIEKILKDCKLY